MAGGEVVLLPEDRSRWFFQNWLRWCPTSPASLAEAERNILAHVWELMDKLFVGISNGTRHIWTVSLNKEARGVPLVLVHGMGSGVGLWALNIEKLAKERPVYAFDMLGFGRSSRPDFSGDPVLAEAELIESMEEWRKAMKLERFVLLGHSLGGFLSASYALTYPRHVEHLVLVDPWGFPERPGNGERQQKLPRWIRCVAAMLQPFNPLAGLRAAGPWGPSLVHRFRPDLLQKFSKAGDESTVSQYIYHCNARHPSGEAAFKTMSIPFGWAKHPMIKRIGDVDKNIPMTLIYGSRSWVDNSAGYEVQYQRKDSQVNVQIVKGAGHHVYADQPTVFNDLVNNICRKTDEETSLSDTDIS